MTVERAGDDADDREPKRGVSLRPQRHFGGIVHPENEGRDGHGEAATPGDGDLVIETSKTDGDDVEIDAHFFPRLPNGGGAEVCVALGSHAAGQRDLAAPAITGALHAFHQQHFWTVRSVANDGGYRAATSDRDVGDVFDQSTAEDPAKARRFQLRTHVAERGFVESLSQVQASQGRSATSHAAVEFGQRAEAASLPFAERAR